MNVYYETFLISNEASSVMHQLKKQFLIHKKVLWSYCRFRFANWTFCKVHIDEEATSGSQLSRIVKYLL